MLNCVFKSHILKSLFLNYFFLKLNKIKKKKNPKPPKS